MAETKKALVERKAKTMDGNNCLLYTSGAACAYKSVNLIYEEDNVLGVFNLVDNLFNSCLLYTSRCV